MTLEKTDGNFDVTLKETRKFDPPAEFERRARVKRADLGALTQRAAADPEAYWAEAAKELEWSKPWSRVLDWKAPEARWFEGGQINASTNCLDRHVRAGAGAKTALLWEGEPGEKVSWSYAELLGQVESFTAALRKLGLKKGDCVAIYMPLVPEAVVAMLSCARGGFPHTVVFGGFSAEALKDRINDAQAKVLITADGGYRKGTLMALKPAADQAAASCASVKHVISLRRARAGATQGTFGSDAAPASSATSSEPKVAEHDWHQLLAVVTPAEAKVQGRAEPLDSEHPLFILYTSGTTGKPKGIVHTTGGYLTGALRTTKTVFDLRPDDVYWCTADIGWVTGHTYVVYGPLAAGATVFLYEGLPTYPDANRIWSMIAKHRVSILYTAPTAIRSFMKLGDQYPKGHDLKSLRLLGTVGEPINPEAWMWYRDHVGGGRCPIVDTYWQTETGAIVISPLPGAVATKPGSATLPLPGYDVEVLDKQGNPVPRGSGGYLVIRKPWPSMARTIHGDPERFKQQYFSEYPNGVYFTGDGARKDEDGYIWCLGRVDDVVNVSGHRLGTMEVESALVAHPNVAEAAVVGRPDDLKGQAIVAFVTLKAAARPDDLPKLATELKAHVVKEIGALARPEEIRFAEALPKTRSGKIMRRLLRELASTGQVKGDTTTLEDFNVLEALHTKDEE